MATVFESWGVDGSLIGHCDAKCHDAKGDKCRCVCGGLNHGVGLINTIVNTEVFHKHIDENRKYVTRAIQRPLFSQEKEEATQ